MSFSFGSPNFFSDGDWANTDTSQFLWDSPQFENQALPSASQNPPEPSGTATDNSGAADSSGAAVKHEGAGATGGQRLDRNTGGQTFPVRVATEENSSQSSSSDSSARRKRKASAASSPGRALFGANPSAMDQEMASSNDFRMEKMFEGNEEAYQFDDSAFPVGQDMNNLSLNAIADSTFGWDSSANSPDPMNTGLFGEDNQPFNSTRGFTSTMGSARNPNVSPPMTVQPSKTFFFGEGSGDSPDSLTMMRSQESSPSALFNNNSPLPGNNNGLAHVYSSNSPSGGLLESTTTGFGISTEGSSKEPSPATSSSSRPYAMWPCRLEIDPMPEKSRVETQIPLKLTLHNAPRGVNRLHLPAHTISKPKFQAKPAFEKSPDTLELSAMLVCASAMEKPGVEESAFKRAAAGDIYVDSEENQPASMKMHADENNPAKPLNGGPVAICSGCIARERKRAARKKTKKAEEEEEWLKDEAKRVIVFNCPEVRDWCVPGTKETTVKEHDTPLDSIFVNAPMRIACYCRHQSEKTGFRVLFTITTSNGVILAQAITQSIMITDDHKQPTSGNHSSGFSNSQMTGANFYQGGNGFGMPPGAYPQPMPFRNSFSTNDLRGLGNQFPSQGRPQTLSRESSGYAVSQDTLPSTATATPRNLSRPASPTNQSGPTKKRRSGGTSHKKMPSGLTMTRLPDMNSSPGAGPTSAGPTSGGPMNTGFAFSSQQGTGNFAPAIDQYQSPSGTTNPFRSGPPTPLQAPAMPFGNNFDSDMYFYSAPTSQHPSRAPSPSSGVRGGMNMFSNSASHMVEQSSNVLARLPAGFNFNRPPIVQRVISTMGPISGGDEITILGTGFFQNLEVMFGDNLASSTTLWGDTTLVCRAPAARQAGMVQVMFKHQYQSRGQSSLRGLLPTQPVHYEYFDDDRQQMQMLAVGASNGQSTDLTSISQEELSRAFMNATGGFPNFSSPTGGSNGNQQQRPTYTLDLAMATENEFEGLMLRWLDTMDMRFSPYSPQYNKKARTGSSLLSLAAGRGYSRFCAGLLARGANPNTRDRGGFTPLMMAAMRSHLQTMSLLVVKGADPALRTLSGLGASDLVSSPHISELLSGMSFLVPSQTTALNTLRRPSSTPSVDSLSGISTSSQASNKNEDSESLSEVETPGHCGPILRSPWDSSKKKSPVIDEDGISHEYFAYQSNAALSVWREQLIGQLVHFQQTMQTALNSSGLQLPSLPSLPQSINKLDYHQYYEQYPMVRRISDFLSPTWSGQPPPTTSTMPPAYEDIFPQDSYAYKTWKEADRTAPEIRSATGGYETRSKKTACADGISKCSTAVQTGSCPKDALAEPISRLDHGSVLPWIMLLLALALGVWNCAAPDACVRTVPLTRLAGLAQTVGAAWLM